VSLLYCVSSVFCFCICAQSKLKRNVALLRQVKNLKRQNLSLRRTNRALQLQVSLDKEATDKLNDPILYCQLDSCAQPQHEDLSARNHCADFAANICAAETRIYCAVVTVLSNNTHDDSSQPYDCDLLK
jgi:hypothetical protein